ncbi:MAG TPA: hypothetical protein VF469_01240 [Kofleriaceae bacterium]
MQDLLGEKQARGRPVHEAVAREPGDAVEAPGLVVRAEDGVRVGRVLVQAGPAARDLHALEHGHAAAHGLEVDELPVRVDALIESHGLIGVRHAGEQALALRCEATEQIRLHLRARVGESRMAGINDGYQHDDNQASLITGGVGIPHRTRRSRPS